MAEREGRFLCIWLAAALSGCASSDRAVMVDRERCEARFAAVVQKTDAPRMNDWASAGPALLGSRGGRYEKYFVFLTDAGAADVHAALLELGARIRTAHPVEHAANYKGLPPDTTAGDPVQIFVEWQAGGRTCRLAYEDFFAQKIITGKSETIRPWTPHFVFHGTGALQKRRTGCIACTHSCSGGIIANNQLPLPGPIPILRADWRKLPKPGTRVTVVIRPIPAALKE
ncbi:MAG: YdjY domain-containing protein [Planctomycetota bacterium]